MANRLCALFAVLIFSGLYALKDDVDAYISEMWVGTFCGYVNKACAASLLFNLLLTIAIICIFMAVAKRVFCSSGNTLRAIGYVFSAAWLLDNGHWIFAKTCICGLDYGTLATILLLAMLFLELAAMARTFFAEDKPHAAAHVHDDKKGYCMDMVYARRRETGWGSYVDELLALMPAERLRNESLAIGISGNWGSGKTSFLDDMRTRMNDNYRVVCFNPWTCANKEQIVSQFFALLSDETDNGNRRVKNVIQRYRDLLLDIDIHPSLTFLARMLPASEEESLSSLKDRIEKAISADGAKPLAVLIDDLDRLEGDELFEVLRLVRITANFRNVVFIVAYDRTYVCQVLNETKNIKRADEYLQKIFHVEVSLPKFEDHTLLDIFMEELARIAALDTRQTARIRRSVSQLLDADGLSFADFVPNFRQARRFANIFALNMKMAKAHTKDLTMRDFLGIELVHFASPETYQALMNTPMTLLKKKHAGLSKLSLLVYDGDSGTPTGKLLHKLFSDGNVTANTSFEIRTPLCYANYFCFRLPDNAVGATEFEMAMTADNLDDVRSNVCGWMQRRDVFSSLYEHFLGYQMHGYKEAGVIRNFFCALLEFLPMLSESGIEQIMADRYWVRTGLDVDTVQRQLVTVIEHSIEQGRCLKKINHLLTTLYKVYPDGFGPDDIPADLLEYVQIKGLAEKSLSRYVRQNGRPSPVEISRKDSSFGKFLMSASYVSHYHVVRNDNNEDEYRGVESNFMSDELIRQYQGSGFGIAAFREFMAPYRITTDDPIEQEYEAQAISDAICATYGSFETFKTFVHSAFIHDAEIDAAIDQVAAAKLLRAMP